MSHGAVSPARRTPARAGWLALAVIVIGVSADSATAGSATRPHLPLAVRVTATGCSAIPIYGSGVAVGGALVATVAHVVAGATEVQVAAPDGRQRAAHIVAIDTEHDVAVLDIDDLDEAITPVAELSVGEHGMYVGYSATHPALVSFTVSQAASIVSEDIYVKGHYARPGYVLQAPVKHGDSGAGLVRHDGTLGGLVWAASRNDETQGWGVGIDALTPLLAAARSGAPVLPVPCGSL